jgi:hypothetical protein
LQTEVLIEEVFEEGEEEGDEIEEEEAKVEVPPIKKIIPEEEKVV